jgi:hypothetical protein
MILRNVVLNMFEDDEIDRLPKYIYLAQFLIKPLEPQPSELRFGTVEIGQLDVVPGAPGFESEVHVE